MLAFLYNLGVMIINDGLVDQDPTMLAALLYMKSLDLAKKTRSIPQTVGRKGTKNHLQLLYIMRLALDGMDAEVIFDAFVEQFLVKDTMEITMGKVPVDLPVGHFYSDFAAHALLSYYIQCRPDRFSETQQNHPMVKMGVELYPFAWSDVTRSKDDFAQTILLDREPSLTDFKPANSLIMQQDDKNVTVYWLLHSEIKQRTVTRNKAAKVLELLQTKEKIGNTYKSTELIYEIEKCFKIRMPVYTPDQTQIYDMVYNDDTDYRALDKEMVRRILTQDSFAQKEEFKKKEAKESDLVNTAQLLADIQAQEIDPESFVSLEQVKDKMMIAFPDEKSANHFAYICGFYDLDAAKNPPRGGMVCNHPKYLTHPEYKNHHVVYLKKADMEKVLDRVNYPRLMEQMDIHHATVAVNKTYKLSFTNHRTYQLNSAKAVEDRAKTFLTDYDVNQSVSTGGDKHIFGESSESKHTHVLLSLQNITKIYSQLRAQKPMCRNLLQALRKEEKDPKGQDYLDLKFYSNKRGTGYLLTFKNLRLLDQFLLKYHCSQSTFKDKSGKPLTKVVHTGERTGLQFIGIGEPPKSVFLTFEQVRHVMLTIRDAELRRTLALQSSLTA